MSKDRKKVVHIHSNVNDKQPTPATLELGELGVNNAAGNAFISTKNSNNEVVRFSEDGTIVNWMEYKEVIPYEAYVRGSNSATTDVTTDDLANNKSNIVIKLNQVAARNTEYDEKVNGAKDIYGNEINPISADGYKDGAGLAIDMSRYAMIGANPSFSSVTTTCGAELQGKTSVKGSTCGSELDVNVNTIKENATTIDTTACTRNYNNTNDFKVVECTEGQGETQIKSCKKFNVKSNDIVLEQCGSNGETRIKSCSAVTLQSKNIIMTDTDCGNGEATFDVNDLCLVGRTKINVYGSETNVGIDCDDNPVANNTNVYGNEILVSANTGSIIETASNDITTTANKNITVTAGSNLCEKGENSYFYGTKVTHIGQGCDGNKSSDSIIYERIPSTSACGIKASTVDGALDEVLERNRVYHSETTGSDGAIVHTVWQDSGSCKNSFTFEIRNSKVKMSADTYPAESEYLKKYVLWQEFGNTVENIGTIDIPKDHILKNARIVNGHVSGETFTQCVAGDDTCEWFIELIWNVFDPETGHADDKVVYLPANSLVQDYEFNNTPAIKFNTYYDGQKTQVSADTTIKVHSSENGDKYATKENGTHTISGYTLTINQGGETVIFDPFDKDAEITMNHSALAIDYGVDVTEKTDDSYDTSEAKTVYIPTSVGHLSRGKLKLTHNGANEVEYDPSTDTSITLPHSALTIDYGVDVTDKTGDSYDTSEAKTVYIPTSVGHLSRGKFSVKHCNDEVTFDPSTDTSITMSHGTLKLTHNDLVNAEFDPCTSTSYTMNHSALTINYGKQGAVTSSVTYDTSAQAEIYIPNGQVTIEHCNDAITFDPSTTTSVTLSHGTLSYTHNGFTGTFDPCTSGTFTSPHSALTIDYGVDVTDKTGDSYDTSEAKTVYIPTSVGHLSRGKLKLTHNGANEVEYDPSTDTSITLPHSALTIDYGVTCNNANAVNQTYDTSNAKTIVIPKTISDITNGTIQIDECGGECITVNGNICAQNHVINAEKFYATSDERLKENIQSISFTDYEKAGIVDLKSFNFKDDETKTKTYGVIAQSLKAVGLDNIVHNDDKGNLNVDYTSFLILRIASLESQLKSMEEKINDLMHREK